MRLRSGSEYAEVIRASLPTSGEDAPYYGLIAQQTAGRLGLTDADLGAVRPNGWLRNGGAKFANQHRSTLSAVLFRMRTNGEICCSGGARDRRYWLAPQARYAGATRNPTHEEIAKRAFEIFAGRGYPCSHEQDWLQAERELRGE